MKTCSREVTGGTAAHQFFFFFFFFTRESTASTGREFDFFERIIAPPPAGPSGKRARVVVKTGELKSMFTIDIMNAI